MSLSAGLVGAGYLRLGDLHRSGPYAIILAAIMLGMAVWFGRHHVLVRAGLWRLTPHRRRQTQGLTPYHAGGEEPLPPVILLDGEANTLSVARDLSAMGVKVWAIGWHGSSVRHSRHVRWIDIADDSASGEGWARYLLGPDAAHLEGAVLLACGDAGLQVLSRHRDALRRRYQLDLAVPEAQTLLLDKQRTYELAQQAGVVTPRWWSVRSRSDVEAIREALVYPLIVKPRLSHLFDAHFGRKFIVVEDFAALASAFDLAQGAGMEMMLVELIPGGDDQLCSYFTYLDEAGVPQFHFTKRVIRRYPTGMGAACYHITDWIPELIAPSNRLLDEAGMRGLANIEFKRDPRDGQYKLIECNARFVASNALVSASGYSLACFVYNRIINRPFEMPGRYRLGMRQWDPIRDWRSFRELNRMRRLTFGQWLRSVAHPQTFAYFRWRDPKPALSRLCRPLARSWSRSKR